MRKKIEHLTDTIIALEWVRARAQSAMDGASNEDAQKLSEIASDARDGIKTYRNWRTALEKRLGNEKAIKQEIMVRSRDTDIYFG